jgi:AraC-like DNA-binding protein
LPQDRATLNWPQPPRESIQDTHGVGVLERERQGIVNASRPSPCNITRVLVAYPYQRAAAVGDVGGGHEHSVLTQSRDRLRDVTLRQPGPVGDLRDRAVRVREDVAQHERLAVRQDLGMRSPHGRFADLHQLAAEQDEIEGFHLPEDTSLAIYRQRYSSRGCVPPAPVRRYARSVTPEELANLAHLRRARDLMDREYARPLDVDAIARAALMSSAHFSRQFRAAYGETPYAYLMTRRIERAKALLRRGDMSVTEVCIAVGCSSLGSFSARFTQLVGETPTAYRARDHSALASVPGCVAKDLTRPSRKPSRIGEARVALAH